MTGPSDEQCLSVEFPRDLDAITRPNDRKHWPCRSVRIRYRVWCPVPVWPERSPLMEIVRVRDGVGPKAALQCPHEKDRRPAVCATPVPSSSGGLPK